MGLSDYVWAMWIYLWVRLLGCRVLRHLLIWCTPARTNLWVCFHTFVERFNACVDARRNLAPSSWEEKAIFPSPASSETWIPKGHGANHIYVPLPSIGKYCQQQPFCGGQPVRFISHVWRMGLKVQLNPCVKLDTPILGCPLFGQPKPKVAWLVFGWVGWFGVAGDFG